MKTFVVVLREEHENIATVTLDEEVEDATAENAARLAKEWRSAGDLSQVTHHDARVVEARAWEMGAPCDLQPASFGHDYLVCKVHEHGLASPGMTRCYDIETYEAEAPK